MPALSDVPHLHSAASYAIFFLHTRLTEGITSSAAARVGDLAAARAADDAAAAAATLQHIQSLLNDEFLATWLVQPVVDIALWGTVHDPRNAPPPPVNTGGWANTAGWGDGETWGHGGTWETGEGWGNGETWGHGGAWETGEGWGDWPPPMDTAEWVWVDGLGRVTFRNAPQLFFGCETLDSAADGERYLSVTPVAIFHLPLSSYPSSDGPQMKYQDVSNSNRDGRTIRATMGDEMWCKSRKLGAWLTMPVRTITGLSSAWVRPCRGLRKFLRAVGEARVDTRSISWLCNDFWRGVSIPPTLLVPSPSPVGMGGQRAWLRACHHLLLEEMHGCYGREMLRDPSFPWALYLAIDAGPFQLAGGSAIDTGPWQAGRRPDLQTGERFVTLDWLFPPPHQTRHRAQRKIRARLRQLHAYAADFRWSSLAVDYPDRVDKSHVSYNWDGLDFPYLCLNLTWQASSDRNALRSEELPLSDGSLFAAPLSVSAPLSDGHSPLLLCNMMNWNEGRQGGARAPAALTMHVHHPHIGEVISVSANGRTATTHAHVVHSQPAVPEYIQEDSFTNAAVASWEFSYNLGDTALVGEIQPADKDGIRLTAKKRVYENSVHVVGSGNSYGLILPFYRQDYPMLTWATHQDEYLDEVLRLEGAATAPFILRAAAAGVRIRRFDASTKRATARGSTRRAADTLDSGMEWNFLEQRALKDLGLVVQLGHPAGYSCDNPWKAHQDFVVIDVTGCAQRQTSTTASATARLSGGSN
ncbi:hypothetical protein B0H14DRAFT_2569031 [Mycena olivaceomarginata]|nr:hypothetical protein B0H14DRAFT_2569031 [Mycena olivaceomarginata]